MTSRKKLVGLGFTTYGLATALIISVSYFVFILYPRIEDWELFSYNFYGAVMIHGVSLIPFLLFVYLIKLEKLNSFLVLAVLIVSAELASLVISGGESILLTIFSSMLKDENYMLLVYPFSLVASFFIMRKLLKIDFNKSS